MLIDNGLKKKKQVIYNFDSLTTDQIFDEYIFISEIHEKILLHLVD